MCSGVSLKKQFLIFTSTLDKQTKHVQFKICSTKTLNSTDTRTLIICGWSDPDDRCIIVWKLRFSVVRAYKWFPDNRSYKTTYKRTYNRFQTCGQHQFLMSRYNNIYRFHPFYLNPRNIIILTLILRWLVECRLQEYRSGINTNLFTSEGKNHFMFFLIIISIGYNMDQC